MQAPANRPGGPAQHQVVRYPNGQPYTVRMADGGIVRRNQTGHVVEVHTPGGAVIHHAPTGVRRVEVMGPGGRVVVATNRSYGYVQRPVVFHNYHLVQRTYLVRGVSYVHVYRPMTWGGVMFNVYTPVRYYRPAFYGWAFNPWPRPVYYRWGWMHRPWYGYYGGYFAPYPYYVSPTLWLTDFLIAATLDAAYDEWRASAVPPPPAYPPMTQPALTPEVKQMISDEVRRQIDLERAESQNPNYGADNAGSVPPLFTDNTRHTFVVSSALLVSSGRDECALGEGSVIQTLGAPRAGSPVADAVVLASKPQECRKGAVVTVQLQDLQEMQNHMRETISQGLGDLQAHNGKEGLPALPPNTSGIVEAPFASQVRADSNVSDELTRAGREADQAEQSVIDDSAKVAGGTDAAPITISLGQTTDQVIAALGQPQKIVDLGEKRILIYPDMKITFTDNRVVDVQ